MGKPRNNLEERIGTEYVMPKQAEARFQHQVGQTIREYRVRNDLTQQEAADRYGCGLRYWQFLEQGQNISLKALQRLAKILDIKPSKLLE